jgi:hypothetical protein
VQALDDLLVCRTDVQPQAPGGVCRRGPATAYAVVVGCRV